MYNARQRSAQLSDKGENWGTVTRVVRLLQCLAEADDLSLKELSQRLGLPPSTVHRLLQLLAQHDLVARAPNGQHYRSGVEFFRLASLVLGKSDLGEVAEPLLKSIVKACNELCFLIRYLPAVKRVAVARKVDATHPLRYDIPLFEPSTLLWGATGRSVLAFLPPEERDEVLRESSVSPVTGQRLPPRKAFLRELDRIREAGYVCTRGQKMPGAVGIGAPVFSGNGHVIGSICITVPQTRFDPKSERRLAGLTVNAAARLSAALGFRQSTGNRTADVA